MPSTIDKKRERALILSIVAATAFVGFWVGLRQKPAVAEYASFSDEEGNSGAQPARTNAELASHPWSGEAPKWTPPAVTPREPITPKDSIAYQAARDARSQGRAFEGAPPTIPHPVGQGSAKECLVCHRGGAQVGNVIAPPIPHQAYQICTQCHVPQSGPLPMQDPPSYRQLTESSFEGQREAPYPYRESAWAPPQQPHQSFMREECGSCHGSAGTPGLQTSHPERKNCQQCHAPSAQVDQRL